MSSYLKSSATSRWFAASAGALAIAMTMGLSAPTASATECLLDTNTAGVVGAGDTDGGASTSGAPDSLACGAGSTATINSTAVGAGAKATGVGATATGNGAVASNSRATATGF